MRWRFGIGDEDNNPSPGSIITHALRHDPPSMLQTSMIGRFRKEGVQMVMSRVMFSVLEAGVTSCRSGDKLRLCNDETSTYSSRLWIMTGLFRDENQRLWMKCSLHGASGLVIYFQGFT